MTEIISSGHRRRDLKQLEQAITKGWEIPERVLEQVPKIMASIIASGSTREKISATRVLVAMHKANQPTVNLHAHQHMKDDQGAATQEATFEDRREQLRERIVRIAADRKNG